MTTPANGILRIDTDYNNNIYKVAPLLLRNYGIDGITFNDKDWFSRHSILWEPLIAKIKPTRVLEIGSYEGRSTCYILKACALHSPVDVYCIDTWLGGAELRDIDFGAVENRFDENVRLMLNHTNSQTNPSRVHKRKGLSSVEMAKMIANQERFDLIYIDGSHKASDVFLDAAMAFELLRVGGGLIFDDYNILENPRPNEYAIPTIAIDAFMNVYNNQLEMVTFTLEETEEKIPRKNLYQVYFVKIAEKDV